MTRKIDAKHFKFLKAELGELQKDGLDAETADRVLAMYEPVADDPRRHIRRIFQTLAALAVLMLGFALFLVISHNWKFVPPLWKMIIVLVPWGTVYLAGILTRRRAVLSDLLLFGAAILYGVAIWQIAQVFNYPVHFSEGLWLWGVGVWLMALAARTPFNPLFAAAILAVWLITGIEAYHGLFGIPTPFATFSLVPLAAAGWFFFRKRGFPSVSTVFALLLLLWGCLQPCFWDHLWNVKEGAGCWFVVVWSGLFFLCRILISKKSPISAELFILGIMLLIVSGYRINAKFAPSQGASILTLTANVAALSLAFFLLRRRGTGAGKSFALAICYFLAWAIVRYVDLFGEAVGYLGAALLFLVTAFVLFGAAAFWKNIRVKEMPSEKPAPPKPVFRPLADPAAISILIVAALLQAGVLGWMIGSRMIGFSGAEVITVQTTPIDPRDMLRGDYVRLEYSFSRQNGTVEQVNADGEWETKAVFNTDEMKNDQRSFYGRTIYTIMGKGTDGIWVPVKMTPNKPSEGVFLKGIGDRWRVHYGIESYYVEEGQGESIEQAMRSAPKQVMVDLAVRKDGKVRIKNVRITE